MSVSSNGADSTSNWRKFRRADHNLHLRGDRLAEVYRVWKPTRTGDVWSVEAFAADGELVLQIFGYRKTTPAAPWNALVAVLPRQEQVPA